MKIYGKGIYDNERADLVGMAYIEFSIRKIQEHIEWLAHTDEICQSVLGYMDMLLRVSEKSEADLTAKLKASEVARWEKVFHHWLDRVETKIPGEYRSVIRSHAHTLFAQLHEKANALEWL